jgi:hypothetical protein
MADLIALIAFINARLAERKLLAERISEVIDLPMLREVEALCAVVDDCARGLTYPANVPLAGLARRTLAHLAAFWPHHPDYRPEWRA